MGENPRMREAWKLLVGDFARAGMSHERAQAYARAAMLRQEGRMVPYPHERDNNRSKRKEGR